MGFRSISEIYVRIENEVESVADCNVTLSEIDNCNTTDDANDIVLVFTIMWTIPPRLFTLMTKIIF
jgi:hypothetical protein